MGKIRQLPEILISQIAAGEVIERPCYVVKELIENSIDAKASEILIEIEDSGLNSILVSDNGEGMDQEDIEKCFLPHTTSKLNSDLLTNIQTLGFRGEALSSIASVSKLKMTSRTRKSKLGFCIEIDNGEVIHKNEVGARIGTSVLVRNLFEKVPARKKFLKSNILEYRQILEIVIQYALSFSHIRFEFRNNKKIILNLDITNSLLKRIEQIFENELSENLLDFKYSDSYLKLNGFIAKPQIATKYNSKQYIFVNNRRVYDPLISGAIKEAYGDLLEDQSNPVFIFNIEVPSDLLDINIHPRKEIVAFPDQKFLFQTILNGVKETLSKNNLTYLNLNWIGNNYKNGSTNSYAAKLLKSEVLSKDIRIPKYDVERLIQVHDLYLICPSREGLMVFDQHAVHERILYEKFKKSFLENRKKVVQLEKSLIIDLSNSEALILLENINLFKEIGFGIEEFGNNTFKLESVPELFKDWDFKEIIKEILEDLLEFGTTNLIDSKTNKMLQYLACRSAIKAGDKLEFSKAQELLKELEDLDLGYTCPHGRPVKIDIPLSQFDKLFKRK